MNPDLQALLVESLQYGKVAFKILFILFILSLSIHCICNIIASIYELLTDVLDVSWLRGKKKIYYDDDDEEDDF